MISTILFDTNDVLYSYDRSVRVAHIARICREPAAAVAEAIWASGFEDSGDNGVMDADAYLSGFGERLGRRLTQDEWTEALRAAVSPIAETLTLAASVRRQARVAVLTNNNLLVKRTVDTVFPELRPIFGRDFFVSAEFYAPKPEPEAYLRCLARVGAAADATLFVDDSAKNVAGAERAGLRAHMARMFWWRRKPTDIRVILLPTNTFDLCNYGWSLHKLAKVLNKAQPTPREQSAHARRSRAGC
jgi:putative hydrolase of the HAD superfamily